MAPRARAEEDVALHVRLSGGVDHHRRAVGVRRLDATIEGQRALLCGVVGLYEDEGGGRFTEGGSHVSLRSRPAGTDHDGAATAEADHLFDRCAKIHPVAGLEEDAVLQAFGIREPGNALRVSTRPAGGYGDGEAGRRTRRQARPFSAAVAGA